MQPKTKLILGCSLALLLCCGGPLAWLFPHYIGWPLKQGFAKDWVPAGRELAAEWRPAAGLTPIGPTLPAPEPAPPLTTLTTPLPPAIDPPPRMKLAKRRYLGAFTNPPVKLWHDSGFGIGEYAADWEGEFWLEHPGATTLMPIQGDLKEVESAIQATERFYWDCLDFFAYDSRHVLVAHQLIHTPQPINAGEGILRLGLIDTTTGALDWLGWIPLPHGLDYGDSQVFGVSIETSPDTWRALIWVDSLDAPTHAADIPALID